MVRNRFYKAKSDPCTLRYHFVLVVVQRNNRLFSGT